MSNRVYSNLKYIPTGMATSDITKGCLVLEGGAFRGVYSQGVMDFFMQKGVNLECVIGVSAGAMGGVGYVSGQIGRSARINLSQRHNPSFIGAKALLKSKSIINLDFALIDYNRYDPLNEKRFYAANRRFVAVATNCLTGEPVYFEKDNCSDMMQAIKASASMPYISPMVWVDGIPCLDGGCSDKIPYQWALDQNYGKVVVIRTREREYRKPISSNHIAEKFYRKYPEFAERLQESDAAYNRQCEELLNLESAGRIFTIAPSEKVTVSRLEKDMEKLGSLYWMGYYDAHNLYTELAEYLYK